MIGLYSLSSESRWLEYASYLTITLTEESVDYNRYIPGCEDALEDCEFIEIEVDVNIESKTMQPKYSSLISQISNYARSQSGSYTFSQAVSQLSSQSQDVGRGDDDEEYSISSQNMILATQEDNELRFLATQNGGGLSLAFDNKGINQALLSMVPNDSSSSSTSSTSSTSSSNSSRKRGRDDDNNNSSSSSVGGGATFSAFASLTYSNPSSSSVSSLQPNMKRARLIPSVPSFDTSSSSSQLPYQNLSRFKTATGSSHSQQDSISGSRKRTFSSTQISTSSSSSSSSTASWRAPQDGQVHRTEMNQRVQAANLRRQKSVSKRKVTVYRQYRDGELPDVQMKMKDVIRPLRSLCECDNVIAKEWMSTLFKEVVLKQSQTSSGAQNYSNSTLADLVSILRLGLLV